MKKMHGELKDRGTTIADTGNHDQSPGVHRLGPDGNKIEGFYTLPQKQWPKEEAIFDGKFSLGALEQEVGLQAGVASDPSSIHWDE